MTQDLAALVERYVERWNEADADVRTKTIRELWHPQGANYTAKVQWKMVDLAAGAVASIGLEFPVLDGGRIVSDHQFIVS